MGNREALLAAAKRCLYEKGYARTTARDLAKGAGVSLAAIGYHFGSKEALLNAALMEATSEWGEELGRVLQLELSEDATPIERFGAIWTRVVESLLPYRKLWAAQFEIFAQIDHVPEIRAFLAEAMEQGRLGIADLIEGIDPEVEPERARAVGGLYHAILSGLLVQWLADPERAPTGPELAEGLQIVLGSASPVNQRHSTSATGGQAGAQYQAGSGT